MDFMIANIILREILIISILVVVLLLLTFLHFKSIRKYKNYLRLFKTSSLPVLIVNEKNDRILSVNNSAENFYGINSNDFLKMKYNNLLTESQSKNGTAFITTQLNEETEIKIEQHQVTGKSPRFIQPYKISFGSKSSKNFIIIHDVTKFILLEKELLEQKNKAEQSDRLKSSFLANMSHEIRTPLNNISGFAELLLDDDFPTEDKFKFYKLISKNTDRLLKTINNIISISLIETNSISIKGTEFNLNSFLLDIWEEFLDTNSDKEDEINFNLSLPQNSSKICLMADKSKLRQIIEIILDNAVQFTKNGEIELKYSETADFIKISVSDTGCGVDDDTLKSIFNAFSKLKSDDNYLATNGGLGLGLPIARALCDKMGGQIQITSKKGEGTLCTLHLPKVFSLYS